MNPACPVGFAVGIAPNLVSRPSMSNWAVQPITPTKDLVLLDDEV